MFKTILRSSSASFRAFTFKTFHTSPTFRLREIFIKKPDDKTTVIEAKYVPSPRTPFMFKTHSNNKKCILCQLQLDIKHTDVLILSQFVNSKGELLRKNQVGLCDDQYELIKNLVHMAQHAGLMPEPPRLRQKKPYEMLNTYYDEKTILIRKRRPVYANKLKNLKLGPIENLRVKPHKGMGW